MPETVAADLAGRVVLVTGASTGIGAAAARAFAAVGCRVAIHYNASLNRAEEVAADVRFDGAEAFLSAATCARRRRPARSSTRRPRISARSTSWSTTRAAWCSACPSRRSTTRSSTP